MNHPHFESFLRVRELAAVDKRPRLPIETHFLRDPADPNDSTIQEPRNKKRRGRYPRLLIKVLESRQ